MKFFKSYLIGSLVLISSIFLFSSWKSEAIAQETVEYVGETTFKNNTSLSFDIKYKANKKRQISVEFWKGDQWIVNGKTIVNKGEGVATVEVALGEKFKKGKDYLLKFDIRPVGTTWKEAITKGSQDKIIIKR